MFITPGEILAIVVMTVCIGYIFSDQFRKPRHEGEYDPLKAYSQKRYNTFDNIKHAAMIAAPTIVIHEFAHKLTAMGFGAEAVLQAPYTMYAIIVLLKMVGFPLLFFIGGYVTHTQLPALESSLVSLAGPLSNLILWGLCSLLVKYEWVNRKYFKYLIPMGKLSMFLAVFNMIPLPGFDGWNFFTSLYSAIFG